MFSDKMKKILAAGAITTAVVCTNAIAANVTVTASALNVRTGPSTSYKIITTVKKGTVLKKLGTSGNWIKVEVNGKTGYVSGQYVKNSTAATSSSSTSTNFKVKITASSLNVRKGAGTNYAVIGGLKKNATATVVGKTGSWYKIKYGNGYGYISAQYATKITSSNSSSSSSSSTKVNYNVKVTASSLNVRKGAGTNYAVIGNLKKGNIVKATNKANGWYKIQYQGGTGYISAEYAVKTSAGVTSGSGNSSSSSTSSSSTGAPTSYKWKKTFEATAYTGGGTTASGLAAKVGRVAVDPKVIPLGSELYISGYGYCVAADTGGAVKGNIVDLYFNTYSECINFGRRNVTVYLIK